MTDIPFDPVGGSHIPNFQDLKPFQQRNSLMLGDVNFCVVCGNRTKFDRGTAKSFIKTCSPDHSNIIRKKNLDAAMIKKYGVKSAMQVPHIVNLIDRDAVQEKRLATIKRNGGWTFINTPKSIAKTKQTNIQKYGVDCIFKMPYVKDAAIKNAHTPSANAKRNATNISRYGAVTVLATQDCIAKTIPLSHSDSANAKRKIKMKKRFGGGSPFCDDRVCDKRRQTMISKYGVQNVGELTRLNDDIVDQMQKLYADGLTKPSAYNFCIWSTISSFNLVSSPTFCTPYFEIIVCLRLSQTLSSQNGDPPPKRFCIVIFRLAFAELL